jgi:hypothetical protein
MRQCRHRWELVSTQYQPPPSDLRKFHNATTDLALRLVYGQTVIRQRCTECGWTEYQTVKGKAP